MSIKTNEKYNLGIMFYPGSNINRFRLLLQSLLYKRKDSEPSYIINRNVGETTYDYTNIKNIDKYNPFLRMNPSDTYFKKFYLIGLFSKSTEKNYGFIWNIGNTYYTHFIQRYLDYFINDINNINHYKKYITYITDTILHAYVNNINNANKCK